MTSAIAVPAYNGIPVTHRDFCSSVHIITGHKKKDEKYDIDFEALVRTKGTLVFLMGVKALPDIMKGLLENGCDPFMPAAVLQKGTLAGQKRIVATVSTLEEEVERQGVETPAIIVVGRVCSLAQEFAWYEDLPLAGTKILVTRPRELVSAMSPETPGKRSRGSGASCYQYDADPGQQPSPECHRRASHLSVACVYQSHRRADFLRGSKGGEKRSPGSRWP